MGRGNGLDARTVNCIMGQCSFASSNAGHRSHSKANHGLVRFRGVFVNESERLGGKCTELSVLKGLIRFQRTTLLELQEEMIKLVRTTSQGYTADLKVYRETKKWRAQRLDDDLSEANRLAHARVTLLAVRVRDAKARALVNNLSSTASQLGPCQTYAESGDLLLRQLDDEVEANE